MAGLRGSSCWRRGMILGLGIICQEERPLSVSCGETISVIGRLGSEDQLHHLARPWVDSVVMTSVLHGALGVWWVPPHVPALRDLIYSSNATLRTFYRCGCWCLREVKKLVPYHKLVEGQSWDSHQGLLDPRAHILKSLFFTVFYQYLFKPQFPSFSNGKNIPSLFMLFLGLNELVCLKHLAEGLAQRN